MKNLLLQNRFHRNIVCFTSKRRTSSIFSHTNNENLIIPRVNLNWSEDKIIRSITNAAKSGGPYCSNIWKKMQFSVLYNKGQNSPFLGEKIQIVFAEWRNNCIIFPYLEPHFEVLDSSTLKIMEFIHRYLRILLIKWMDFLLNIHMKTN